MAILVMLALRGVAAQLPELRIEPTAGGSILIVKNAVTQPLTAFLIELVDYPGSSYSYWQDDVAAPLAPGAERRIQITNMTVGAVPDYVKMQGAIYADGATAGIPEKVTSLVDRRRFLLETTRELIRRLEKTSDPAALDAGLREWMSSLQPGRRVSQATINQNAGRGLIQDALSRLKTSPPAEVLSGLKTSERLLAASKPVL